MPGEGERFLLGVGLGDRGIRVDEVVGAGVLGEEGEHGLDALGTAWYVVLLEGDVVAEVHDGVEVQIEAVAFDLAGVVCSVAERGEPPLAVVSCS